MKEITARLIVHEDVESPAICRSPPGTKSFPDDEPRVCALLARKESGTEVRLPFVHVHRGSWAHIPLELDGQPGWKLLGWFDVEISCDAALYQDIQNDRISLTWDLQFSSDIHGGDGGFQLLECAPLVVASLKAVSPTSVFHSATHGGAAC